MPRSGREPRFLPPSGFAGDRPARGRGAVALASLTPWAPQAGGTHTDGEAELLHLVAPPVGVDRDALRRSWARVPAPLRSGLGWLVVADVLLTGAVLAVATRQAGMGAVSLTSGML